MCLRTALDNWADLLNLKGQRLFLRECSSLATADQPSDTTTQMAKAKTCGFDDTVFEALKQGASRDGVRIVPKRSWQRD
jgi:hypothetical protein